MREKRTLTTAIAAFLIGALLSSVVFFGVSCQQTTASSNDTTQSVSTDGTGETDGSTAAPESSADTDGETESTVDNALLINREESPAKSPSTIYEENLGSVVGIRSVGKTTNIFGQTSSTASSGTGFVIRADGYIMTNYHVVDGGGELTVTFADGSSYEAELVGFESDFSDIAILKIEADGLVPVTIGTTADRRVGEDVVIIGNPLGELTFSLSRGVISALNRRINADGRPLSMMQIDAAVNAGNSGGPAFGPDGKVIGIVTAKYASESIEGLGFCIPAEDAAEIASDLIAYGYVRGRASLGVACEDAYEVYVYYYRYYGKRVDSMGLLKEGVYIGEVLPDSPAAKAGLQKADYIVAVNGKAVADCAALSNALADAKPGDTWTLTVSCAGQTSEITVTLDEYNPLSYGALSSGTAM